MKISIKQKHTNPYQTAVRLVAMLILLVLLNLGVALASPPTASADIVPIPIGCPGSNIQGPPTSEQLKVCSDIPVGCPGSTKQGPPAPDFNINNCPYGVSKPSAGGSGGGGSGSGGSGADCSSKVENEEANCEIVQECEGGNLDEDNCGITKYLKIFINTLSAMVGIVVVASLVVGGIQYSTSAGDPNAAAAAKQRITNSLLALVAFGLMYGFLQWVVPGGVL